MRIVTSLGLYNTGGGGEKEGKKNHLHNESELILSVKDIQC